jgi:CMP-N,N'-diacetyllegionaminic acid synthase
MRDDVEPDVIVLLQPTSPLRRSRDIDAAIALLDPEVDSVVSVCAASHSPYKMYSVADDRLVPLFPAFAAGAPRQTLPVVFRETGAIYVSRAHIIRAGSIYGTRIRPFVTDEATAVDIDTATDVVVAEALWSMRAARTEQSG